MYQLLIKVELTLINKMRMENNFRLHNDDMDENQYMKNGIKLCTEAEIKYIKENIDDN